MSFFPYFVTFCHINLHFYVFFTLCCGIFHLNFHFSVFFTLCCDFLSLKSTFYVVFTVACFEPPEVNIGDNAAEMFLDQVLAAATICRQHLANKIPRKWLTQEQWREYSNATNCSICIKPFMSTDKKVCNHNRLTVIKSHNKV